MLARTASNRRPPFSFRDSVFYLLPTCSLSIVRLFIWDGLVGGSRVPVHSFNF